MQSQQRQHNSSEGENSSKEIPNQASLVLGESLLMENSETQHRLIGSSKLKKRAKKVTEGSDHRSVAQKSNHESLEKLIQAQIEMKNQMLLSNEGGIKNGKMPQN